MMQIDINLVIGLKDSFYNRYKDKEELKRFLAIAIDSWVAQDKKNIDYCIAVPGEFVEN